MAMTWRIHEEHQNVLEVIELCALKEFPSSGLRLVFQEALCPFAFMCESEGARRGESVYLLYVLTISGVAILCNLRSPFSYVSGSILSQNDIVGFNLQTHIQSAKVTAVKAKPGCLVSLMSSVMMLESGVCGLSCRGNICADFIYCVKDQISSAEVSFMVYSLGFGNKWLVICSCSTKVYPSSCPSGQPSRLWVGEADDDQELISLAVLHQGTMVPACDHIGVYAFSFGAGERFLLSPEPSVSAVPLLEGKIVDLKISTEKLWILKEVGPMLYEIVQYNSDSEEICSYVLQEDAISEQMFQSSESALDDLVWTADSVFSSMKEHSFSFISSMFLRRLLQPGVNHCSALRETLLEYKRFLSDSEFQSLTTSGLRKEILSIIEQEGSSQVASSTVYHWKKFSARYLHNWCWNNRPYGLLLDTNSEVFGLIRKGSFSLFRCLEGVEQLIYGSSDDLGNFIGLGMKLSNDTDGETLIEVLRCMGHINHLLGRSSAAIYYESLISSVISPDEVTSQILKILESGFSPQSSSPLITLLGTDAYVERRQTAHKSQRKFSVEMLLSFHKLQSRSTSWSAVFDVIDKFMKCLDTKATSQVARTMFEAAFDLFLFLSYLVGVGIADELSLHRKLGSSDFTLACLLDFPKSAEGDDLSPCFPSPTEVINLVRRFSSSIMCRNSVDRVDSFLGSTINLAAVLIRHGQYEAAQNNRAASGQEAPKALKKFSSETGFQISGECRSISLWRLHYYEWAMQIFEQNSMREGACQFALAALEQVDSIVDLDNGSEVEDLPETTAMIKGRLWANVFKYSLDLKNFRDAYCAIISNPDDDSKYVCLRRFIIVLCELGETKVICNGEIPFTGLVEKVEQELFWKAERSDLSSKPNLYKVLYSFEAYRNNWRKAAGCMYRYFVRLSREGEAGGGRQLTHVLQEKLHALSTAINSLQLVEPSCAWLDSICEADDQISPSKKPRNLLMENSAFGTDSELSTLQFCVDIEILEKEYTLTEALYMLSTVNSKSKFSESYSIEALTDILVNENLYDLAFTIVLKFWKESGMKRELERVFAAIAQQCCPNRVGNSGRNLTDTQQLLLLPSSEDDGWDGNSKTIAVAHQVQGSCQWETLELYLLHIWNGHTTSTVQASTGTTAMSDLGGCCPVPCSGFVGEQGAGKDKYKDLHPRLPVIVAETLLYTDPEIELPLWLIQMFKTTKGGNRMISWGMSGKEADPAALFRLYTNYGRHTEAASLLVEYLDSFASSRPMDVLHRKKMSAAWFPYTTVERFWCQLEEMQGFGHSADQCDRLKKLLHGALMNHLQQVSAS
uniref:Nuclear pore complex protein NUP160 domain-containing protein n=1 Tax=Aegilops tauschii TaxID=37682 RepID=N1QPW6_AEGTA